MIFATHQYIPPAKAYREDDVTSGPAFTIKYSIVASVE